VDNPGKRNRLVSGRRILGGVGALLLSWLILMSAAPALAHGGGDSGNESDTDACAQIVGSGYMVHMGAYQPETGGYEEFCRDIPNAGETILVFDLIDGALHNLPIAVKILDFTQSNDGPTVAEFPARTYPTGVVEANVNLPAEGEYAAVMTIDDGSQQPIVTRFRLKVGGKKTGSGAFVVIGLAVLVIAGGIYYSKSKKKLSAA
jgi:hypothetical protein